MLDGRDGSSLPVVATDADLAADASAGDEEAFEALYRRHAASAWRVAQAVTGNPDDAADAVSEAFTKVLKALPGGRVPAGERFRPYLMAATRNAAIDVLRRSGRVQPTDALDRIDRPMPGAGPSERAVDRLDQSLVASAFRALPERWRSVLWLTAVEGLAASEAAPLLGVSANGAAQLAVRARAGLRERYLQAHLRAPIADPCRFSVERLGACVGGGLAPRDVAKVDQHLAGCAACRRRKAELEDLGPALRRCSLPVPALLGGVAVAKWRSALAVGNVGRRLLSSGVAGRLHKPLALVSSGTLALGLVGAGVVMRNESSRPAAPPPAVAVAAASQQQRPPAPEASTASARTAQAGAARPAATEGANPVPPAAAPETAAACPPSGPVRGDAAVAQPDPAGVPVPPVAPVAVPLPNLAPPAPAPDPARLDVGVAVPGTPVQVAAGAGVGDGNCTGVAVPAVTVGAPPPVPSQGVVSVQTGGPLGDHTIKVP